MSSADDIFAQFFGSNRGPSNGPQKGKDILHNLTTKLEDLYNGKTSRLAVNRNKICEDCEGRGTKGEDQNCNECKGRGVRVELRQLGPGMVQQMQNTCTSCEGKGKIIDKQDLCKSCKGHKTYKDRKVLEVVIENGMKSGQKIIFPGEADELPGTITGDVIFVIKERDHEIFKRKGSDLAITIDIEESEARSGFTKTITHLDGRTLEIGSPPIPDSDSEAIQIILDEGMPVHHDRLRRGRMFVIFKVNRPKNDEKEGQKIQCQNCIS
jgi:DnaJ homolog subfamily A member 2